MANRLDVKITVNSSKAKKRAFAKVTQALKRAAIGKNAAKKIDATIEKKVTAVKTRAEKAALRTAKDVKKEAKKNAPVRTGRYRDSIDVKIQQGQDNTTFSIGSDLDYAKLIEFGSSGGPARPVMRNALNTNVGSLKNQLKG